MALLLAALVGGLAAIPLPIGAWLALRYQPPPRLVGLVLGFGAGALLAAIAYELIPPDTVAQPMVFVAFGLGSIVFFILDRLVTRGSGEQGRTIALGALIDGIPESLVLGMGVSTGGSVSLAFFVAVFVSNVPEAFGSTSDLRHSGLPLARIYRLWWSIVAISAVGAAIGGAIFAVLPGVDARYPQAFAAGAVLTMLADSMIPEAYQEGGKQTALLTAVGFAVAAALSAAS